MKKDSQLTMSFPAERKPKCVSAASRVLKAFRQQQRKVYFGAYQQFKRDAFLALNGVQMF